MVTFLFVVLWIFSIVNPILLGFWAYFNAEMRQIKHPGIWGVIVAVVPFYIGWIVYMIYRVSKGVKPAEPEPEIITADSWANFGPTATAAPASVEFKDNRVICSKLLIIYWICFAVNIILTCIFSYLFITSLAAVLMGSLGQVSSGIDGIMAQIPSQLPAQVPPVG